MDTTTPRRDVMAAPQTRCGRVRWASLVAWLVLGLLGAAAPAAAQTPGLTLC